VVTDKFSCDYYWGETFEDPSPAVKKNKGNGKGKAKEPKTFSKYSHSPMVPQKPGYIRRAIIVLPCHTHSIRTQLEMEVYGREYFEQWDKLKIHSPDSIVSCLILVFSRRDRIIVTTYGVAFFETMTVFIDGFGLYRNSFSVCQHFVTSEICHNKIRIPASVDRRLSSYVVSAIMARLVRRGKRHSRFRCYYPWSISSSS
jgi:hypothetical protein